MSRPQSPVRLDWLDPAVCSLEYRLKIVGRWLFFRHRPADVISPINELFHDFNASVDGRISFEGDEPKCLYLVALGNGKLVRKTEAGREVLLDNLPGGDYFGSLSTFGRPRYWETALTQTDGCRLRIAAEDFEGILMAHPDVTRKLLEAVSQRLAESQGIVKQLSTYTAEPRIASALMRLASKLGERRGGGVLIQWPFSRQDPATMTGSTTETLSRVMSRSAEECGVKSGRKGVVITYPKRLEELIKRDAVN